MSYLLVKSASCPAWRRATMYFNRMQLMITILYQMSTCPSQIRLETYKPPSRNIPAIAIFCDLGTWTFDTSKTGNAIIIASITIFGIEFPMKKRFLSRQVPSFINGFQALSMGEHWKMLAKMMPIHHEKVIPPRMYPPIRMDFVGKIR